MGDTSFIELISKGGSVMIPIGLCSVIGLAIIIDRLYCFRKAAATQIRHCRKHPAFNIDHKCATR